MDSVEAGRRREQHDALDRRSEIGRDALPSAVIGCAEDLTKQLEAGANVASLRGAVAEFARAVRAQHVPPERALAAFKFMVFNLPVIVSRSPEDRNALMASLVHMSITEYYANDNRAD